MLKFLSTLTKLAGYDVIVMEKLKEQYPERFDDYTVSDNDWFNDTIKSKNHIFICLDTNSLIFNLKDENNKGCDLKAILSALIELVYFNEQLYVDNRGEEINLKIIDKSQQVNNNLILAFKHLKELDELKSKHEEPVK